MRFSNSGRSRLPEKSFQVTLDFVARDRIAAINLIEPLRKCRVFGVGQCPRLIERFHDVAPGLERAKLGRYVFAIPMKHVRVGQ